MLHINYFFIIIILSITQHCSLVTCERKRAHQDQESSYEYVESKNIDIQKTLATYASIHDSIKPTLFIKTEESAFHEGFNSIENLKKIKKFESEFEFMQEDTYQYSKKQKIKMIQQEKEDFWSALETTDQDIHVKNEQQETLLHYAVKKNRLENIRGLLHKNIDIYAQDKNGQTALHLAVYKNQHDAIYLLLEGAASLPPANSIATLLEKKDHEGATALMHAVMENKSDMIDILIHQGADIFTKNKYNHSLLHFVQDPVLAQSLIDQGLSVHAQGRFKNTPLHFAKNAEIVNVLIRNGADVDAISCDGNTALHITKSTEIMQSLINHHAKINQKNNPSDTLIRSETPLYGAIARKNIAQCKLLIDHGADIQIVHHDVLDDAICESNSYIVDLFKHDNYIQEKLGNLVDRLPQAFPYTDQENNEYAELRYACFKHLLLDDPLTPEQIDRYRELYGLVIQGTLDYIRHLDVQLLDYMSHACHKNRDTLRKFEKLYSLSKNLGHHNYNSSQYDTTLNALLNPILNRAISSHDEIHRQQSLAKSNFKNS